MKEEDSVNGSIYSKESKVFPVKETLIIFGIYVFVLISSLIKGGKSSSIVGI